MKNTNRRKGQTIAEYALIIGLVAVIIMGAMKLFGGSVTAGFSKIAAMIAGAF
ncbi:MAG: Flp family type IVb pilin [Candidatus Firestonebacteria bacterium]|jgi:Flp pilus assembly pilin Flp|nr:Flp family type IVb pilin [Candidatus Firestonebacteria bacterium]